MNTSCNCQLGPRFAASFGHGPADMRAEQHVTGHVVPDGHGPTCWAVTPWTRACGAESGGRAGGGEDLLTPETAAQREAVKHQFFHLYHARMLHSLFLSCKLCRSRAQKKHKITPLLQCLLAAGAALLTALQVLEAMPNGSERDPSHL